MVLQDMDAIESYTVEPSEEADSVRIRLCTDGDTDIRRELSVALSGAGMPILSMNRLEKSLEDIFLELTENADSETEEATDSEIEEDTDFETNKNTDSEDEESGMEEATEADGAITEYESDRSDEKEDEEYARKDVKSGREEADDESNL